MKAPIAFRHPAHAGRRRPGRPGWPVRDRAAPRSSPSSTAPDIHALIEAHGQPKQGWKPDDPRRTAPTARSPRRPPPAGRPTPAADSPSDPDRRPPPEPPVLPAELRRAVTGQRGGWTWLHRFATAMTYPTLTEAAQALGITTSTLVEQLQRPRRPGPDSGWARLERFAVTMDHPTINAAADTIGINRTTLIGQLRRLETDVGEPLYHRATVDGTPQLPTEAVTPCFKRLPSPKSRRCAPHAPGSRASPTDLRLLAPAT